VTEGTLSGFIGSETVIATGTAANYSSENVNTYTGVVISYVLSDGTNGGLAANYSLANTTGTGVITAKQLTISGITVPTTKIYNGTTAAAVSGTASLLSTEAAGAGSTTDGKPYNVDAVTVSGT